MIKKDKRGISPVVTTVLLIMLVIILAIIILLWSRGFIKEKVLKFDKPIDNVCGEVSIRTFVNADNTFGFTNIGNIPIHAVDIKTTKKGGSDIDNVGMSGGGKVDIGLSTIFENVSKIIRTGNNKDEEIKIIPILLGETKSGAIKEYTCPERNGFVVWED